jgi:hypothetical protein
MSELAGLGLRADFSHRRVYAGGAEKLYRRKRETPSALQALRHEVAQMKLLFPFSFETLRSAGFATWLDGTLAARRDGAA